MQQLPMKKRLIYGLVPVVILAAAAVAFLLTSPQAQQVTWPP